MGPNHALCLKNEHSLIYFKREVIDLFRFANILKRLLKVGYSTLCSRKCSAQQPWERAEQPCSQW